MGKPRLIAVDIGNSSTKIGWFDEARGHTSEENLLPPPVATHGFVTGDTPTEELIGVLPGQPCCWKIVSVNGEGTRVLTAWLQSHRPNDEARVLSHRDLPIEVRVDFPERVGLDRLAAAVAANVIRESGRPAIVIDAGSAITVDLVTADGAFGGGVILPGFRMSAEALFGGAELLPLAMLSPNDEPPPVVGKNTEEAIRSGLFWGAVGAVREIVSRMSASIDTSASGGRKSPEVFVTGGDLRRLAEHLGGEARFVSHLVLRGIAAAVGAGRDT